jgi:UDP-N-acetylmuramyl tripeptide synthase
MGTEANVTYSGHSFDMATYITSEAAVNYMAAAALAGFAVGVDEDNIVDGIANYEPKI